MCECVCECVCARRCWGQGLASEKRPGSRANPRDQVCTLGAVSQSSVAAVPLTPSMGVIVLTLQHCCGSNCKGPITGNHRVFMVLGSLA